MRQKSIWDVPLALLVSGIVACVALFIFQATPIFLRSLGWMLPLYAVFSITLFLLVFIVAVCLFFTFVVDELYDRHDLHKTKQYYRRLGLLHSQQRLQIMQRAQQAKHSLPHPVRKYKALMRAYLQVMTKFPFHKKDQGHDKSI